MYNDRASTFINPNGDSLTVPTVSFRIFAFVVAFAASLVAFAAPSRAEVEAPKVKVSAIPQTPAIRGTDLPIAFIQDIAPHWHTYWVNPGDSGQEMKIDWTSLPDGITARDGLQWPVPERIAYGPLFNFGYKDRAVMIGHLRVPMDYAGDTIAATARVTWLVCEEICIPEETTISIAVPVAATAADMTGAPQTPVFEAARAAMPKFESWGAMYHVDPAGVKYDITVPEEYTNTLTAQTPIDYFPLDYGLTDHAAPLKAEYDAAAKTIRIEMGRGDKADAETKGHRFVLTLGDAAYSLESISTAAAADESANGMPGESPNPVQDPAPDPASDLAHSPASDLAAPRDPAKETFAPNQAEPSYPGPAGHAPLPHKAAAGTGASTPAPNGDGPQPPAVSASEPAPVPVPVPVHDANANTGHATAPAMTASQMWTLAKYILSAILGGVILNLMPCVFPVLSIKALSIVRLAEGSRLKIWGHGLAYTAGILSCFAAIGFALLTFRHAGENIGWGFQLQNPNMVIGLSWLLFAVGLNLSGVFEISLGRAAGAGEGLTRKPGLSGAFFTGVLATLVATPCTAPFMGAALGAAILLPTVQAMAVFLALGFGLALPYLLLCFIPALTRLLPRPGAWMDTFRQLMAFPMYASAIWLVWVAVRQVGDIGIFYALGGMLGVAFGIWLLRHNHGKGRLHMLVALIAAAIIAATLAAVIWMPKSPPSIDFGSGGPMPAYIEESALPSGSAIQYATPVAPTPDPQRGTPVGLDPATGLPTGPSNGNAAAAPSGATGNATTSPVLEIAPLTKTAPLAAASPSGTAASSSPTATGSAATTTPQAVPAPKTPLLSTLPLAVPGASRPYTTAALESALVYTTQPILVNMTAAWCITCLLNERTTLSKPEVQDWMRANNVIYFKGDWTNRDPQITEFLGGFGRNGVPLYVFYAGPELGVRPDPVVLPQLLNVTMVKNLIP